MELDPTFESTSPARNLILILIIPLSIIAPNLLHSNFLRQRLLHAWSSGRIIEVGTGHFVWVGGCKWRFEMLNPTEMIVILGNWWWILNTVNVDETMQFTQSFVFLNFNLWCQLGFLNYAHTFSPSIPDVCNLEHLNVLMIYRDMVFTWRRHVRATSWGGTWGPVLLMLSHPWIFKSCVGIVMSPMSLWVDVRNLREAEHLPELCCVFWFHQEYGLVFILGVFSDTDFVISPSHCEN